MEKGNGGRMPRAVSSTHSVRIGHAAMLISLPLVVVFIYSQSSFSIGWWHTLGANFTRDVLVGSNYDDLVIDDKSHLELNPEDTPWSEIRPSRSLVYRDCFHGLRCARLLLPLMWHSSTNQSSEVAVAVIRRPAKVQVTDPRYGGVVIVNPGGPGASGVQKLLHDGEKMQDLVDSDAMQGPASKFFDLIGFDPRGVNHTVPQLNCFSDTFTRLVWNLEGDAEGLFNSSSVALDRKWARYLSRSTTCMEHVAKQGETSIGYYMGTRSVVDDIVGIAERHGEWRQAEVRRILARTPSLMDAQEQRRVRESTKWKRGQETVLYWGISYGTVLGATLATIYPDRVYRMLLDSVVEPQPYHEGLTFRNLVDSDKVWFKFGFFCHKYGPQHCKFYRESPEAILADVDTIASKLLSTPLAVPASSQRGPQTITWSDLRKLIGESLYDPIARFPMIAGFLQDLSHGNGTAFADYKAELRSVSVSDAQSGLYTLSEQCIADGPYTPACRRPHEWLEEGLLAIGCGDGSHFRNFSKSDFEAYSNTASNYSKVFGDIWAEWDLMCAGWTAHTKWRYDGSFGSHTAHPILLVGNTLDPVCPLQDARKVATGFPRSMVLEQNTLGHGMLTSDSKCMGSHVREYFQSGRLPAAGSVCSVEEEPFEKYEYQRNFTTRLRY